MPCYAVLCYATHVKESGKQSRGTMPYLRTRLVIISHWPPSLTGDLSNHCSSRPSSGSS